MDLDVARVVVVAVAPALDRYVWVDGLAVGRVNRPRRVLWQAGGKALNAARVLRQLGVGVTAVVPTPTTDVDRVRGALAAGGVDAVLVEVAGELRQTLTIVDDAGGTTTELYEPTPGLADSEWSALAAAAVDAAADRAGAIVVSGTRPGDGAMADALASLAETASRLAVPLYVDGRPATVTALLTPDAAVELVVKINDAEAAELLGRDDDAGPVCLAALARAVVARGASAAVVTGGERGAAFAADRGDGLTPFTATVDGPHEPGRSPGGSGDAFLAGLVAGRLRGVAPPDALELARRCAEANAAQPLAGDLGGVDVTVSG